MEARSDFGCTAYHEHLRYVRYVYTRERTKWPKSDDRFNSLHNMKNYLCSRTEDISPSRKALSAASRRRLRRCIRWVILGRRFTATHFEMVVRIVLCFMSSGLGVSGF